MKNYSEIYVSLREEIMFHIVTHVDFLLDEYQVDALYELEGLSLNADVMVCVNGKYQEDVISIRNIYADGSFVGSNISEDSTRDTYHCLAQVTTDSLIEIYETLWEYGK